MMPAPLKISAQTTRHINKYFVINTVFIINFLFLYQELQLYRQHYTGREGSGEITVNIYSTEDKGNCNVSVYRVFHINEDRGTIWWYNIYQHPRGGFASTIALPPLTIALIPNLTGLGMESNPLVHPVQPNIPLISTKSVIIPFSRYSTYSDRFSLRDMHSSLYHDDVDSPQIFSLYPCLYKLSVLGSFVF